jgi:hypothetical protein
MSVATLYVYDSTDETKSTPIESCTVFVFSEDGADFVTSGTTDAGGEVTFDLPNETYWVRFFKAGFSFNTGLSIEVTEDSEFEVAGANLDVQPPATLSHLCRVSGFVIGAAGQFLPDVTFEFILNDRIRISGGFLTGNAKVLVVSDHSGYVEFDLLRQAVYEVVIESYSPDVILITVPDAPSTNLTEMLWPFVARVAPETDAVEMAVDEEVRVTVHAVWSSGLTTPYHGLDRTIQAYSVVTATSSDTDVATVRWNGEALIITGEAAGSCTIDFSENAIPTRRAPALSTSLESISVTVS